MTLLEIAQIYTDLVNADSEIPDSEYRAKDLICALRTKYHNMLMEQMQTEGIEFLDRFDATRIAFDLAKQGRIETGKQGPSLLNHKSLNQRDHVVLISHIGFCSHIRLNRRRGHVKNNGMTPLRTFS